VIVADGRQRRFRPRHAQAHGREIFPKQGRRLSPICDRADQHPLDSPSPQHLAEALVRHAIAMQPKLLRAVAALGRPRQRTRALLLDRQRRILLPSIGRVEGAYQRQGRPIRQFPPLPLAPASRSIHRGWVDSRVSAPKTGYVRGLQPMMRGWLARLIETVACVTPAWAAMTFMVIPPLDA